MSSATPQIISIVPSSIEWIESFHVALNSVAAEKRFLLMTEPTTLVRVKDYVRKMEEAGNPFFFAVHKSVVVGWCDIKRHETRALWHCGTLGMGVIKDFRGRGIGRKLAEAAISEAFKVGFQKIELTVYGDNEVAIKLYEKLGFEHEGRSRNFANIDGKFLDAVRMAKFSGN